MNRILSILSLLLIFGVFGIFGCSKDKNSAPTENTAGSDNGVVPIPQTAANVIGAMGTGFNLGNTFDLTSNPTTLESIRPIIDLYRTAGMRHIRIPVTWMESVGGSALATSNGELNVQHPRLIQLKAVIDYAISKNMYVVINAHHERSFKATYNGSAAADSVFTTLWRGIANYFKDYPSQLIFELLNEPDGPFGDWNGGANPQNAQALALTRKVYQVGYKAVRETGGNNARRVIMIGTNAQGNQSQIEAVYPDKAALPGGGLDAFLAIQVHTYDPWSFCGETGSNNAWPGTTALVNAINKVATHARLLGVPVNYGEFGVGRKSSQTERNTDTVREYYRVMRIAAQNQQMSVTPWDDRGWFALISSNGSNSYNFVFNIVPYMMAP